MTLSRDATRIHYDIFLASTYEWMAGGMDEGVRACSRFFLAHDIHPAGNRQAVDLGSGCGFASLALARSGFFVTAVDFSHPMLAALSQHAGSLPVRTVHADIRSTGSWAGRSPELITCTGDTLTHLPDPGAVEVLLRACAHELCYGGRLVISFRDYTKKPSGMTEVIPVRRDPDRIFLCRLEYGRTHVRVTDILYSRDSGTWLRKAGTYSKLRIAPAELVPALEREGFALVAGESCNGMVSFIAQLKER